MAKLLLPRRGLQLCAQTRQCGMVGTKSLEFGGGNLSCAEAQILGLQLREFVRFLPGDLDAPAQHLRFLPLQTPRSSANQHKQDDDHHEYKM